MFFIHIRLRTNRLKEIASSQNIEKTFGTSIFNSNSDSFKKINLKAMERTKEKDQLNGKVKKIMITHKDNKVLRYFYK